MKYSYTLPIAAFLSLTAPTVAQEDDDKDTVRTGAIAQLSKSPKLVEAPLGATAVLVDQDGQRLGYFEDHVIDLTTGAIVYVVVNADDVKTDNPSRLVPYSRFQWDAETREFALRATKDELAEMPPYVAEELQAIDGFGRVAKEPSGVAREASAPDDEIVIRNVTAQRLLATKVFVEDAEFATTSGLLIDPIIGRIGFVLAEDQPGRTASPLIMPWRALAWEQQPAQAGLAELPGRFVLPLTKEQLASAPRLENGDVMTLSERDAVQAIRAFYRAAAPNRAGAAVREKGKAGKGQRND
ncbi:MAG: hypothetical protein WD226_11665 [Planctomycetota bacterium]